MRKRGIGCCTGGPGPLIKILAASMLLAPMPGGQAFGSQSGPPAARDSGSMTRKVVVFGVPGISWKDVRAARPAALEELLRRGAAGNLSVRVSNRAGDGYLSLGAGRRADAGPLGGFAFNAGERVGHVPAEELYRQSTGRPAAGAIVVPPIRQIAGTRGSARFSAEPGVLAGVLAERGLSTAVVGNADTRLGTLPSLAPAMAGEGQPAGDSSIHREIALAGMDPRGQVPLGDVSRSLLGPDPSAPFGLATSLPALTDAFRKAVAGSDLIFVETGDSARADLFSLRFPAAQRPAIRRAGVARVDRQLDALLREVDMSRTLVIMVAPTTPGGPGERGQLRPVLVAGPGFEPGILGSPGTRREGLVTMQDLTATIASFLGVSEGGFGSGYPVRSTGSAHPVERLIELNSRTAASDALRTPFSFSLIALDVAVFSLGLFYLRRGRLPEWLRFLFLTALSFPLMSHLTGSPIWVLGLAGAAAVTVGATLLAAALLQVFQKRSGVQAAIVIPAAAVVFFLADLTAGAPVQLDSIFGYTSVSGGRYYGLGNLGFAMFAASSVLVAGSLADLRPRYGRWAGLGLMLTVLFWMGHPDFGADVGGTLAMSCTAVVLAAGFTGRKLISLRTVLIVGAAMILAVSGFAWIDLSRPAADRTHLGSFVAGFFQDPAASWYLLKRKAKSSATFGLVPWGLLIPVAALVLAALRRHAEVWARMVAARPYFPSTFRALMVAAVAGSVLNDSGVVVGGMVLALTVPWALLLAADSGSWKHAELSSDDPGDQAPNEIPALPRPV